ncbi:MAG: ornithine cyclodeaminase family protein [Planctomycetota bacterium]
MTLATKTLVLSGADVTRLLTMEACIEAVERALIDLAEGRGSQPLRSILWLPERVGALGIMPGAVGEPAALGAKIISVFPGNHGRGLSSHQGVVLLFDPEDGRLLAILDGERITAIRTAAASAVATRALARQSASHLAILGSGAQADTHLEAMCAVRPVESVRLWSRRPESAAAFERRAREQHPGLDIKVVSTAQDAVREADILCTVTAAQEPVIQGDWLAEGAHVNGVGSCVPSARELDTQLMQRGRIFTDRRESLLAEAGDFIIPMNEGELSEKDLEGELGDILQGKIEGRTAESDITIFKSLGIAAEDLGTARWLYEKARETGTGVEIEL